MKICQNPTEMFLDSVSTTLIFIHPSADRIWDVSAVARQNPHSVCHFRSASDDRLAMTAGHGVDKVSVIQQAFGQRLTFVRIQIRSAFGSQSRRFRTGGRTIRGGDSG